MIATNMCYNFVGLKYVIASKMVLLNGSLLKKYGGCLEFSRAWAQSLMSRFGFVMRKGTKAARKQPDDFSTINYSLLELSPLKGGVDFSC